MLQISLELNEHSPSPQDSFEIPKGLKLQERVVTGSEVSTLKRSLGNGFGFSGLRNYTRQRPATETFWN